MTFGRLGRVGRPQRMDDAASREFGGLVHIDAQVLYRLEATDRLVELSSHLGVFDGQVHHRCGCTDGVGGVHDHHVVDDRGDLVERSRRKPLSGRVAKLDIRQLAGLVHVRARRAVHAGRRRVDGEQRRPIALIGKHQDYVGDCGVGQTGDRTAQDGAVVCLDRRRPCAAEGTDGGDRGTVGDPCQQGGGVAACSGVQQRPRRCDSTG